MGNRCPDGILASGYYCQLTRLMRIEDEYGTHWLVKAGDPANSFINQLKAKGFEIVVLPRICYTTGELTAPVFTPGDPILAARLADCLEVLSE